MKRLEGKSALITGSARGIGRAFAQAYIAEGASVAIADINLQRAQATAAELGPQAYAVEMDVTDQASIDGAIAAVVAEVGKLDILINNAALFDLAPIVDITRDSYERLFSINVAGTLFTLQAAARQMIRQGHGGKIINMASQAGRRGEPLVAVYCATKAAVIGLTKSAAIEYAKKKIRVNAVCPAVIDTDMFRRAYESDPKKGEFAIAMHPVGRIGKVEEIAAAVLYLCSDAAAFTTGQALAIDGGVTAM